MKDIFDWAIQLNYYRKLLEREGYQVNRMVIVAFVIDKYRQTHLRVVSIVLCK